MYVVVGLDMFQNVQVLMYNELFTYFYLFFTRYMACLQYSINTSG